MKYYFKENLRLMYADGQLYDENNKIVYTYQAESLFLPTVRLYRGNYEVGYITTEFKLFLQQYNIYQNQRLVGSLDQQLKFFGSELTLEGLGWTIRGDFLSLDYSIHDERDQLIATVSQEIFRMTHQYQVEILDESKEELILLLIIAVNQFDKTRK